ncbi:CBF/Mak21 family-domain-containing protein [Camillea tinctor]|nr:CBF/Mak21 family-domain-containing protein [Camillea tinctor]
MATFDDAALSKLTAKIEGKLAESKKTDKKGKGKRKLDQTTDHTQPPPKKRNFEGQGGKQNGKQNGQQNGKHSPRPKPKAKANVKPNAQGAPQPTSSDVLLNEIKELGGDEEDYKLLADIDSDDDALNDQQDNKNADKSLRAELAKFAAGLGFENVQPDSEIEEPDAEIDEGGSDGSDNDDPNDESGRESAAPEDETDKKPLRDPKRKTIFEPRPDWHAVSLKTLPTPSSEEVAPYNAAITALKEHAKSLLEADATAYGNTNATSSSQKFMSTIMSSGTMSDKVSALTLSVQESPVHNVKAIENLISLGAKRSRGQALAALAALVDLLGPGMILPSDRRLRTFASQLGLIGTLQKYAIKSWSASQELPGKITKEHLIMWVFEDWLKEAYFKMIQSLETWCDDEVEYARTKAVDLVFALLRDKPEQESNLLRLLVNKLGDRERKISSRASYLLLQLLNTHPAMKQVVIRTVEQDIMFRPGQNIRAKYYAVNTLNQTILSTKEPQIADMLLNIYFGAFVSLLKNGDLSQLDAAPKPQKTDKGKKRRPTVESLKRRNGDKDKDKDKDKNQAATGDREAAEKLVSAILTGVNRAVPFSQADSSTLESHLDTLFRITHSSNFNTSIQALMLIQQLSATRHLATERFYRTLYESLLDPRLITSSKQALYLNLLYRSLKADVDVRRVKAFVKRMLQILNLHQPSFICGILYLIMELCVTFPDIRTLINEPEDNDVEGTAASDAPNGAAANGLDAPPTKVEGMYDGRKRDPEYSNAHRSCLWELVPFLKHFHPSVDVYATNLLNGRKGIAKPEFANHTLIAFLDKFVYRNAKAADQTKGTSIMQPMAASGQGHVLLSNQPSAKAAGSSLNSASFWNKKSEDVAVEDVFFHEYFNQIGKPAQAEREKKQKSKKDADEADEEEEEEEGEDEIWEALVSSRPEVQGDSDSDADFDDLMGLDDESDDDLDLTAGKEDGEEESGDDVEMDFLGESDLESDEDEEEDEDEGAADERPGPKDTGKKPESERTKRRKALKNLPTFASAEDYAEMLAQDTDEDY